MLVGHAAFVLARGEFGRHWIRRCLVAGACGSVVYIGMLRPVGGSILKAGRDFYPSFPADLASAVLGGRALTIIPLAILVLAGARRMSREWLVVAGGSLPSSALSGSCQNRPAFSTRASLWLVPAVAVVAALAVARWRMAIALVAVAVAAAVAYQAPHWSDDPYPGRAAAAYVIRVELQRGRCGPVSDSLAAYTRAPRQTDNPRGCDLFMSLHPDAPSGRGFRYRWTLPAEASLTLYSNRPAQGSLRSTRTGRELVPAAARRGHPPERVTHCPTQYPPLVEMDEPERQTGLGTSAPIQRNRR